MPSSESDAERADDMYDSFLKSRGHEVDTREWDESHNKKQCPDCGGIHSPDATECGSCGWQPVPER